MKNNILILGVVVTGLILVAFKFKKAETVKCNERATLVSSVPEFTTGIYDFSHIVKPEELVYKIDTRYIANISKTELNIAKTIIDILPSKATHSIDSYQYARVSILDDFRETDRRELGDSEVLTDAQLGLLQSTRDSENIYIRADYKNRYSEDGMLVNNYLTYFISVVPHQQAIYQVDKVELIQYLKENTKDEVKVIQRDGLKPGKVAFTISKKGMVTNVELTSTSGYESVDNKLVKLIKNMPGSWTPATNVAGDKVEQELIFFFGLEGC